MLIRAADATMSTHARNPADAVNASGALTALRTHTVAASATCGCSPHHIRLQACLPTGRRCSRPSRSRRRATGSSRPSPTTTRPTLPTPSTPPPAVTRPVDCPSPCSLRRTRAGRARPPGGARRASTASATWARAHRPWGRSRTCGRTSALDPRSRSTRPRSTHSIGWRRVSGTR